MPTIFRPHFCIPESKGRSLEGSCHGLLDKLLKELESAREVHIAAYLFNNPLYYESVQDLANNGCKVRITSLPIEGYAERKVKITGLEEKKSAMEFAREVYGQLSSHKNIELQIFPHLYSWYGALYAGGGASYSFHVKAICAKFDDNTQKNIIASANFKAGDPPHSENILVVEDTESSEYSNTFNTYFKDLKNIAIPQEEYLHNYKTRGDQMNFHFLGKERLLPINDYKNCFFTTPYYQYTDGDMILGSNHYAGNRIIEIIDSAKERVWVCSQHFHDLVSFDPERETIISAIYKKYLEDPSVKFRFLKQVKHSSLADKRRAGIAETLFQYVMNAPQRFNRHTHDKFIIVDNQLIVSTANYTPTQFAYGIRKMKYAVDGNRYVKEDYFSETNGFMIIPDNGELLTQYEAHFENLWKGGEDIKIDL